MIRALRAIYHALVPLALRRRLGLGRFGVERQARRRLWTRTGGRIAAGPFAGFRLAGDVPGDCEAPVLLGSYECETHAWLEREIDLGWTTVVNIGSNIGVYAAGLAMRLPQATVVAYEMDDRLRAETVRAAGRNGVGARVRALGKADVAALAALAQGPALVVCDCEGAERELLDPARVRWLRDSAILVELHDFAAPGTTDVLRTRFASTHDVEVVEQAPRDAAAWAVKAGVSEADAALLGEERRPWRGSVLPGRWMLLSPRPYTP